MAHALWCKLELLLAESQRVAHYAGALRRRDLKRVTVDTTVQPKAVTFLTDGKLLCETASPRVSQSGQGSAEARRSKRSLSDQLHELGLCCAS